MARDLERFLIAQSADDTYATALAELRAGRKRSHWMWFVLPQLRGLGRSDIAQHYGIDGVEEARRYLADPVLGPRLVECAQTLLDLPGDDPVAVLGEVDAQKLRSSMTLFAHAATDDADRPRTATFVAVLGRYFGGAEDDETLRLLAAGAPAGVVERT
ncbi:DUF1810 domain-containing protein [Actinotalea sp. C106]|uniref:DUF1810 domain-containing protein n=1 Tax=Actinotalea sp. C106 TaxID=2908644 RepID=UPI002029174E|nr:DUF1810 domain-containing protein [Actinotalea sp. C106]